MIYYNINLVQFMVLFLLHLIYLHCLLNLTKLISYLILVIIVYSGQRDNILNLFYLLLFLIGFSTSNNSLVFNYKVWLLYHLGS